MGNRCTESPGDIAPEAGIQGDIQVAVVVEVPPGDRLGIVVQRDVGHDGEDRGVKGVIVAIREAEMIEGVEPVMVGVTREQAGHGIDLLTELAGFLVLQNSFVRVRFV